MANNLVRRRKWARRSCGFGVDVDAVAGWLGSYGGEVARTTFHAACSRAKWLAAPCGQAYSTGWASRQPGHPRPLDEHFPEQMKLVANAGHEIGIHGYSHENPIR